jgi:hypothetical protein
MTITDTRRPLEQQALGFALTHGAEFAAVRAVLTPSDFHHPAHRQTWTALCKFADLGRQPEVVAFTNYLQGHGILEVCGGAEYLIGLVMAAPPHDDLRTIADTLHDDAFRLGVEEAAVQFAQQAAHQPEAAVREVLRRGERLLAGRENGAAPAAEPAFVFRTLAEWDALPQPAHDWLLPDFIARGDKVLMTALMKCGKTTWAAAWHRTAHDGGRFCGAVTKPLRALWVSEERHVDWKERAALMGLSLDSPTFRITYAGAATARPTHSEWRGMVADILADIREFTPDLVVLDTLHGLWGVEEENSNAEVAHWLAPLNPISDTGTTLLLLGHPSKAQQTEGRGARGAGTLLGWVTTAFELHRFNPTNLDDRRRTLLAFSKHSETPRETVVTLEGAYSYVVAGSRAEVRGRDRQERRAAVLDTLEAVMPSLPPGATEPELLDAWPNPDSCPSRQKLERLLGQLVRAGRVVKTGTPRSSKDPTRFHRGEGRAG